MLTYHESHVPSGDDPLAVAGRLARSGLFDQYVVYERGGHYAFAGGAHTEIIVEQQRVTVRTADGDVRHRVDTGPLDALRTALDAVPIGGWRAYGWACFELSYALAGIELPPEAGVLLHLILPQTEIRVSAGQAMVRTLGPRNRELEKQVHGLLAADDAEPQYTVRGADVGGHDGDAYRKAVDAATSDIRDGLLQKVILSRRVPLAYDVDMVGTYMVGRRNNTPARSFLLSLGGMRAVGFSPETIVEVRPEGRVVTQPLAGTRALDPDPAVSDALRRELLGDAKEIFEHAISVKVAYDELLPLCEPGSVMVEEFMTVKERGSVQHLASQVAGRLTDGLGAWDAFAALFPAVTVSGVPKDKAFEVIRRYEDTARGLYSGAVFSVGADGALDAALVLRSVFASGGETWLRAGAGIVAQSRSERELEETCEKLASVSRHLVPASAPAPDA